MKIHLEIEIALKILSASVVVIFWFRSCCSLLCPILWIYVNLVVPAVRLAVFQLELWKCEKISKACQMLMIKTRVNSKISL